MFREFAPHIIQQQQIVKRQEKAAASSDLGNIALVKIHIASRNVMQAALVPLIWKYQILSSARLKAPSTCPRSPRGVGDKKFPNGVVTTSTSADHVQEAPVRYSKTSVNGIFNSTFSPFVMLTSVVLAPSFSSRRSKSPTPSDEDNAPVAGPSMAPLTAQTIWQCSSCKQPVKRAQGSQTCRTATAALKEKKTLKKTANVFRLSSKGPREIPQLYDCTAHSSPCSDFSSSPGSPFSTRDETSSLGAEISINSRPPSSRLVNEPDYSLARTHPLFDVGMIRVRAAGDASMNSRAPSLNNSRSSSPAFVIEFNSVTLKNPSSPIAQAFNSRSLRGKISIQAIPSESTPSTHFPGTISRRESFLLALHQLPPLRCRACNDLDRRDDTLHEIQERIANGINENTPLIFFPVGGLIQRIRKKNDQLQAMRLTNLNDARMLAGKIAELDLHKQFMMAIATSDEPRISQLIRAGLNNGESIGFTPDDYMVGLCVLRLGGARLADLLHRALGLPGLTTLRKNSVIRPLRASPAMPTVLEIQANIDAYTAGEAIPSGPPNIVHRVLMLDEIAVEKRARWDDKTNMILGGCREHTKPSYLEFSDLDDATTFFERLDHNEFHLASEVSIQLGQNSEALIQIHDRQQLRLLDLLLESLDCTILARCAYPALASTKRGNSMPFFLRKLLDAADTRKRHGNITFRTVSIASDGEAKRGLALALKFMNHQLSPTSPIYPLLQPLEFMNLLVGPDDITPDKDYRHVIKALWSLLMRRAGIDVLGFEIVPAVVKQHLRDVGVTEDRIRALLNPNDRQDVDLTYGLLKEIWSLPDASPAASPTYVRARTALKNFGQLAYHLVMPYIYLKLSLRGQLTHLSTAAHLLLVLFTTNDAGSNFMTNQTFVNIMLMIKNVFFCVAKAKVDMPDSDFFIILLGTDRLEKLFGLLRTAVGTDSNFDILQFASRASNLTEVYIILGLKPHWDRGPRRLKLPAVINERGDVSSKADHISPASWIGDLRVGTVVPHTCWTSGRLKVEGMIATAREQLNKCARITNFDILSPFGELLVGKPDTDAAFEIDPELLGQAAAKSTETAAKSTETAAEATDIPPPSETPAIVADEIVENFEDVLAIHDSQSQGEKHSPHVLVNGKKISKASILKDLMQNRSLRLSTDRTKRVAGIPAFANQSPNSHIAFDNPTGAPSLRIGNPIATLVECEGQVFLAVGQVNTIILGSQPLDSIVLDLLTDRSTKISYQMFQLLPTDRGDDPDGQYDWKWSLGFESRSIRDIPGHLIHPLNPTVSNQVPGKPTNLFSSAVLITVAASINSQSLPTHYNAIPVVSRSETFPYRCEGKFQHYSELIILILCVGKACFHVEPDTRDGNRRGEFGHRPTQSPFQ
ncbi:hypothetical protein B0H13DRAFT_1858209 [Mycena leptocephala]|nr:hypothetical protein B0H13DRAFT_1858209 [Mycena leptocephala]